MTELTQTRYLIANDGTLYVANGSEEPNVPSHDGLDLKEITEYEYNDLMLSSKADDENAQRRDEAIEIERK